MAVRRLVATLVGGALVLGAVVSAPAQAASNVTLNIWSFGNVFEDNIVMKYGMIKSGPLQKKQAALIKAGKLRVLHKNITLNIGRSNTPDDANFKLSAALPGNAAPDVAAIEMAYMGQTRVKSTANQFIDLNTLGAKKIAKDYLPFRYTQGTAQNGHQVGIPTDVGGLAVAYRIDLFKKAGLPTKRAAVAKLWPTWEKFIATGKKFQTKSGKTAFMDSSGNMFQAMLNQGSSKYVNPRTKKYDYKRLGGTKYSSYIISNKAVLRAFNITAAAGCTSKKNGKCAGSIGTKIPQFNTGWGAAIEKNAFATILAPAWALDYVKQFAPKSRGKWDIAAAPGVGGNLGGSMLAIPKKAHYVPQAWAFIKWYLAPAQQLDTFKQYGLFPTTYKLYNQPAIKNYKDRFFNSAPLGQIYSQSAIKLKPITAGPLDRAIDNAFGAALSRVSFGNQIKHDCGTKPQTTQAAWCQAVSDIQRIGLAGK